jgi:hypothetical protein
MSDTIIIIKNSNVPGKVPQTTDLQPGELAANTYDGKLYLLQDTTSTGGTQQVVEITGGTGNGYVGSQGETGYDGSVGYSGSAGAGYTGSKGETGYNGSKGIDGYTGSAGAGYTGSKGETGYDGSKGELGYSGSVGIGYDGSKGETGYDGSKGEIGYTGSQGVGYTGSVGIGYDGSKGADGYTGSVGIGYTGSTGSGYSGSKGEIGYTGSVGIGYTGSVGTGYDGSKGADGYDGSKGDLGYTGSVGISYTGSKGTDGYDGSKGDIGYSGSLGYTGSAGDGYTGSVGYTGSKGQLQITTDITAPGSPNYGDIWIDSNTGIQYFWINDGNSDQWVEDSNVGIRGPVGYTGSSGLGNNKKFSWSAPADGTLVTGGTTTGTIAGSTASFVDSLQGVRLTNAGTAQDGRVVWNLTDIDFTQDISMYVSFYQSGADGISIGLGGSNAFSNTQPYTVTNNSLSFWYKTNTDKTQFYKNGTAIGSETSYLTGVTYEDSWVSLKLVLQTIGTKRYAFLYHGSNGSLINSLDITGYSFGGNYIFVGAWTGGASGTHYVNAVSIDYI